MGIKNFTNDKGRAVLLQVWSGPDVSRKLRLSALSTDHLYPQEINLILIYVRG